MKTIKFISTSLFLLILSSCKTLNTNINIPQQKLPERYEVNATDSSNIAQLNWKAYFGDEHLIQLIDTALANNLDLQIALQRIVTVESELLKAKGKQLPNVDLNSWAGRERVGEYSVDWAGNEGGTFLSGDPLNPAYNDYYIGLTSSWEIDIWGKLKSSRKAALSRYLASIEGSTFVKSNLVANVATLYYELLALDNELETLSDTIEKQEEALAVVSLQKEVGKANALAVQQFQAQLLNTQARKKETLQAIAKTENALNFLLGRYPQPIERTKTRLFQDFPHDIKTGLPAQLLTNRPDIRQAALEVEATKFDLKAAKTAFFPSINIGASVGYSAFNPKFLFTSPESIAYSITGGLTAPLINRKALKAEFNTAKANQLEALYNYQKSILNGYIEVSDTLIDLKELREIIAFKDQENGILAESIEASEAFYKMAKASYLEVLSAHQNYLQSKLELIDAHKQKQIATVNLYKALGGGWY